MKRLTSIFLLSVTLALPAAGAQKPRSERPRVWIQPDAPTHTGTVTFATWNIEWFPAEAGLKNDVTAEQIRTHMEAVAQLLDAENPTVLVASEVRAFADALALNKMLKHPYPYIAVTDYLAANAPGAEDGANKQEQAIFSRLPWKDVWEIDLGPLPWADNRPPRGFINATIRVRGANVEIYGAHLKANYIRPGTDKPELTALKNVEKRERGVHYLLEDIARRGLKPLTDKIIIAGDFNTDLYAERFAGDKSLRMILQAGFFNAFEGLEPAARVTIPTKNGEVGGPFLDTTFDYILTSVGLGQLRATVVQRGASKNADVGPGSPGHASDHYMVKVTLP